jgi:hypothetical protein
MPGGALDSVGRPRSESCEREPGTREVRVHIVRLGGRHRSDASRVFSTGRPQGLLVIREGASQEEVRSPTDEGRGWAEGETVRARSGSYKFPSVRPAGLRLQVLETMEGVSGLVPASVLPPGRSWVLWLAGQLRITIREERGVGQQFGRTSDSDSGVPAGDEGNVRGRRDSVKAPQGPRRPTRSPHPRRSKRRRSQRCAGTCSAEAGDSE